MPGKNFALIGVGGYIAPRHLRAIKDTGNILQAAYDRFDSVGIMDSFFPDAAFFTEQELFDRHCSKLKGTDKQIEMLSVCTPNYLHDAHMRYGLRLGADVICEKPAVLNPHNIDAIMRIEEETGHKAYNILQLRLHDSIAGGQGLRRGPDLYHLPGQLVLRLMEGRRAQERGSGHEHRRAFLRHAAVDIRTGEREHSACEKS